MACREIAKTGSMLLTYKCSDPLPHAMLYHIKYKGATRDVVSVSFKNEVMDDKL
jgi:hypothetical protein